MLNQNTLHSVGVTVRDLDATMTKMGQVLGIDTWEVSTVEGERIAGAVHRGRRVHNVSYRTAVGTTTLRPDLGGGVERNGFPFRTVTFELVEPLSGESLFKEFLATRGQGISHIVVNEGPGGNASEFAMHMKAAGIALFSEFTVDGERRVFHDTRKALGGFVTEVRAAGARTAGEPVNVSGRYERPAGVGPIPVIGVSHFGVVIDELMATLPEYHRLFGLETFPISNWQACLGSLDKPYFRDDPNVDHAYFTAMGTMGDFQFEIIQPTRGPSDYNVGFKDPKGGPGVHHMLLYTTSDPVDWSKNVAGMAAMGHRQYMGSDLRFGMAEFCYFDTAHDTGFVVEAVLGGKKTPPPDAPPPAPFYLVDFTELIAE